MIFEVINKRTGRVKEYLTYEEMKKHELYCDFDEFAITENGHILVLDKCGHARYLNGDYAVSFKLREE